MSEASSSRRRRRAIIDAAAATDGPSVGHRRLSPGVIAFRARCLQSVNSLREGTMNILRHDFAGAAGRVGLSVAAVIAFATGSALRVSDAAEFRLMPSPQTVHIG